MSQGLGAPLIRHSCAPLAQQHVPPTLLCLQVHRTFRHGLKSLETLLLRIAEHWALFHEPCRTAVLCYRGGSTSR